MAGNGFICPSCRTWFEGEGNHPTCPACGHRVSPGDRLEEAQRADEAKDSTERSFVEPARSRISGRFWLRIRVAAVLIAILLFAVVFVRPPSEDSRPDSSLVSLGPTAIPSFESARSIPLRFVDDSDPEVTFVVDELQISEPGECVRLHMTITNLSEAETLSYQPGSMLALAFDQAGADEYAARVSAGQDASDVSALLLFESPPSAPLDQTLPRTLGPQETWSGWVLLHGIFWPNDAVAVVLLLREPTELRILASPDQPYITLGESLAQ